MIAFLFRWPEKEFSAIDGIVTSNKIGSWCVDAIVILPLTRPDVIIADHIVVLPANDAQVMLGADSGLVVVEAEVSTYLGKG